MVSAANARSSRPAGPGNKPGMRLRRGCPQLFGEPQEVSILLFDLQNYFQGNGDPEEPGAPKSHFSSGAYSPPAPGDL